MLGKKEKDRKELSGPIEIVGNGELAVQSLIEQLSAGDEIQKIQEQPRCAGRARSLQTGTSLLW